MIKKFTLLVTIILTTINLFGQTTEFVKCDSITYPIHKANIGKIAFMNKVVPIEIFTQKDFLTTFELKENTDLNIRVFFAQLVDKLSSFTFTTIIGRRTY